MTTEKHLLLARSWTTVAQRYDQELVPRFAPYTQRLLSLFLQRPLPLGPVYVPACGPGHELVVLGEALPGRQLFGTDLAAGMVDTAKQKLAQAGLRQRAVLAVGDASGVPDACRPAAGIFSCFSLQQMPQPATVLARWAAALAPGGVLAVAYWPPAASQPDARWRALTEPATLAQAAAAAAAPHGHAPALHAPSVPAEAHPATAAPGRPKIGAETGRGRGSEAAAPGPAPPRPQPPWDVGEPDAAAAAADADVLADEAPAFDMRFDSAAAFFDVLTHAGPLQARLQARGLQHMAELRQAFVGSCLESGVPFVVRPAARLVVLRRRTAAL